MLQINVATSNQLGAWCEHAARINANSIIHTTTMKAFTSLLREKFTQYACMLHRLNFDGFAWCSFKKEVWVDFWARFLLHKWPIICDENVKDSIISRMHSSNKPSSPDDIQRCHSWLWEKEFAPPRPHLFIRSSMATVVLGYHWGRTSKNGVWWPNYRLIRE